MNNTQQAPATQPDSTETVYSDGTWVTSRDGNARASFVHIGEGYYGEYDETDPEDAALYRLDVEVAATHTDAVHGEPTEDPNWVYPADGSICTAVRMDDVDKATCEDLLGYAAESIAEAIGSGTRSIKGVMDNLSFLPTKR